MNRRSFLQVALGAVLIPGSLAMVGAGCEVRKMPLAGPTDDRAGGSQQSESTEISEALMKIPTIITKVVLQVRDLNRCLEFYEDIVGLQRLRQFNGEAHLGVPGSDEALLVLRENPDAIARRRDMAGLFHIAFRVPDQASLADALRRITASSHGLTGASDHQISHALYLDDPEGNGLEIYCDNPRDQWPIDDRGHLILATRRLDLQALLQNPPSAHPDGFPPQTDIGHIHLEVVDIEEARRFYAELLHLDTTVDQPSVLFTALGGYHHHIGLNSWNRRTSPRQDEMAGLVAVEAALPGLTKESLLSRAESMGFAASETDDAIALRDQNNIGWVLRRA